MAVTASQRESETVAWAPWPPYQNHNSGYAVMNHCGLMQYNSQPVATLPPPRPALAGNFGMEQHYAMSPVMVMHPSHYPSQPPFGYNSYTAPPSALTALPYRQHQEEHLLPRVVPTDDLNIQIAYQAGTRQSRAEEQSRSPVVKNEPMIPARQYGTLASSQEKPSRTVALNEAATNTKEATFDTPIDELLKAIQPEVEATESAPPGAPTSPLQSHDEAMQDSRYHCDPSQEKSVDRGTRMKAKRFTCPINNCRKRFAQNSHLETHLRSHAGQKPWKCPWPGCNKLSTQHGNHKSHMRRHTGERPFACEMPGCKKKFVQKGGLIAHLNTHTKEKRFYCHLGCGKDFSQRGNLKTHQNKFHQKEVQEYMRMYNECKRTGVPVPEAHRDKLKYFAETFKNSNKGIAGRGKGNKYPRIDTPPVVRTQFSGQQTCHVQQASFTPHHGLLPAAPFGHYEMPGTTMMSRRPYGYEHGYEQYDTGIDMDQASVSSGTMTPVGTPGPFYEDAFQDRMYFR
ncbi:Uu.00g092150.m01.CDS01 [Anthostomella pinea]|uniref:Uu.00g092150.m01.CDS01 n=1 Tax=Anthostomella pinea TaxID=933095 RepID=A0AAI8VN90_9PEZI|nr:Uu.00g092150.m01.CDS01 [Anthostomella pinea]